MIEIPAYLTTWDADKVVTRSLRQIQEAGTPVYIDMWKVKHVFSATARLIMRIYDRACQMNCQVKIVRASEPVQNALAALRIDEKIPVDPYSGAFMTTRLETTLAA
jgi:anti-anti-sigma regulatory factor